MMGRRRQPQQLRVLCMLAVQLWCSRLNMHMSLCHSDERSKTDGWEKAASAAACAVHACCPAVV